MADGEFVLSKDRSLWRVGFTDRIDTQLWLEPGDESEVISGIHQPLHDGQVNPEVRGGSRQSPQLPDS